MDRLGTGAASAANERTTTLLAVSMTWTRPAATKARAPSGVIAMSPLAPTGIVAVTVYRAVSTTSTTPAAVIT